MFAFIALDSIFRAGKNFDAREEKCRQQCANVYQIEKDVMYLNLIYVYLVTNGKMPFQWETNSIWQSANIVQIHSKCRFFPPDGEERKNPRNDFSNDGVKWR